MHGIPPFQPKRPGCAVSNTERQREFRERHPGYYQRLHAQRRAALKALAAECAATQAAILAIPAIPIPTVRLALPAPAEVLEIPGMTTIPALSAMPALSPLPVFRTQQATLP